MPIIEEVLNEQDLPLDLAYLAMIESGFNPRVDSRTHNSGLWQFGSATGEHGSASKGCGFCSAVVVNEDLCIAVSKV